MRSKDDELVLVYYTISKITAQLNGVQCGTYRIFAVEWGTRLLRRILLLSSHGNIAKTAESLHFVAHNISLTSTIDNVISLRGNEFGEITQNNCHHDFQVTNSGTNGKLVCDFLCMSSINLPHV